MKWKVFKEDGRDKRAINGRQEKNVFRPGQLFLGGGRVREL